jgi:hypothetical protein
MKKSKTPFFFFWNETTQTCPQGIKERIAIFHLQCRQLLLCICPFSGDNNKTKTGENKTITYGSVSFLSPAE